METLLALRNEREQKKKNPTIVLLFDEMDVLLPDAKNSMEGKRGYREFLSLLRGISQEHEGFLVVGITAANPNINRIGQWKEGTNPMFQFCQEIPLTLLEEEECAVMIQTIGRLMQIQHDSESLRRIFLATGGHPFITRQLGSCMVEGLRRPCLIQVKEVEKGLDRYLAEEKYTAYIADVCNLLEENEKDLLTQIAGAEDGMRLSTLNSKSGTVRKTLASLKQNLLVSEQGERVWVPIGLVRRWIQQEWG